MLCVSSYRAVTPLYNGLLKPLPVPAQRWKNISVDFRFSANIERAAEFLLAMATSRNCGETHSETMRMKAKFR
jgi:hypothetical protein